ncbi:unnamed protein product [Victoria cruziana]
MDEKAPEREAEEPQKSDAEEKMIIHSLIEIGEAVSAFGDYRRGHRKECFNLVRRIKLLGPLLEEVRENGAPLSEKSVACFGDLKKAFLRANKLLKMCNSGSKIYLALDGEGIATRFRTVYEKLNGALEAIPYGELGISDEVKEQVDLMLSQLKRTKRRTETQDIELAMDMMVVFSKKDDRNADSAILERLANKLELHTFPDLQEETSAVKQLAKEVGGWASPEMIQQIIDVLNKFKQIAGVKETSGSMEETEDASPPNKCLQKCQSLSIPNDFLCPITLEIMSNPVIVATGQTYERSSIQRWLSSGHRTCPITRQPLAHLSLAPNYALRNLITHWCEMYNVELPKREADTSSGNASPQTQEIAATVQNLSSSQLELQRSAVLEIRELSKENPDNRILIAKSGGIPPLVNLLSYPDSRIQENAVTALLNLSIDETNKRIIAKEEAIPAIIEVLTHGNVGARENSAAALFSLSMVDDNKVAIGSMNGIPPLVDLLQNGTVRGKRDAATALFNLSLNQMNRGRAVKAGITKPLLQLVTDKQLGMVDEALSILLLLSSNPEGRSEIGQLSFIQTLVELLKDGTPKNKECACAVLLELAANNSSHLLTALQFGVYEHLVKLAKNGTNRAQRKAQSLLHHMSKCEQIP